MPIRTTDVKCWIENPAICLIQHVNDCRTESTGLHQSFFLPLVHAEDSVEWDVVVDLPDVSATSVDYRKTNFLQGHLRLVGHREHITTPHQSSRLNGYIGYALLRQLMNKQRFKHLASASVAEANYENSRFRLHKEPSFSLKVKYNVTVDSRSVKPRNAEKY